VADEQRRPPRKHRSSSTSGGKRPEPPDTGSGDGTGSGYPGEGEGESVEGHAEFVARLFGGGVEATPELIDRAVEVWQRLPGAVVRSPAQIRPNRPAPVPPGDEDAAS
jgi:hypothetical protein